MPSTRPTDTGPGPRMLAQDQVLGIASTYQSAQLPAYGDLETFRLVDLAWLSDVVRYCVEEEGPIHVDRVVVAIARSFGIARVGDRIRDTMYEAVRLAGRKHGIRSRGEFLWSKTMRVPPVRCADAFGTVRPIGQVAPEEISTAIVAYLGKAFSISRDDLVVGVARELGYERTGGHIATAIGREVDALVREGAVQDLAGQVSLVSTPSQQSA